MIKKFEEFVNENFEKYELKSKLAKELSDVLETDDTFVDDNRSLLISTAESFDKSGETVIDDLRVEEPNEIHFFGEGMPVKAYVYEESEKNKMKEHTQFSNCLGVEKLNLEGINRILNFCFMVPDDGPDE